MHVAKHWQLPRSAGSVLRGNCRGSHAAHTAGFATPSPVHDIRGVPPSSQPIGQGRGTHRYVGSPEIRSGAIPWGEAAQRAAGH